MERLKWNFGVINLLIETSRGCELTIHIVLPSLSLKQQVHPVRQLYDCGLPVRTKFRHYKVQFSVTLPPACFLCPPSNTAHRWGAGEGSGESHRSAGASACGLKEPAAMSWCQPPSDRHKGKNWMKWRTCYRCWDFFLSRLSDAEGLVSADGTVVLAQK